MQITGAILPKSYDELTNKIEKFSSFCPKIQIDISDGLVGREITWSPLGSEILPHRDKIEYEFDLMVFNWRDVLKSVLSLSPSKVVMHIDSFDDTDLKELGEIFSASPLPLGLSTSNDAGVEDFKSKINRIRSVYSNIYIQVMGIRNIGAQGQLFDEECIPRIQSLKKDFGELFLQVDGAMRPETAIKVVNAGADGIVVGSYLQRHDDPTTAINSFSNIS